MKCKRLETDGYWNKSVKQELRQEQEQGSTARR